jgi:hypothetical protein
MSGDIPMIHGYEEQHGDERGNDKFDEVTWAELVRLREETRWHVELRITTRCPSCGHQSLFIGKGGHLTCSWLECKEPGLERAIEKLASAPSAPKLRVLLADAWWDGALYTGERSCHAMKQACDAMLREKVAQEEPTQANSAGLIAKWRAEAERCRSAADEVRRRGAGSRQAIGAQAAHSFSVATLEACANDLEALSSSAPVERPQRKDNVAAAIAKSVEDYITNCEMPYGWTSVGLFHVVLDAMTPAPAETQEERAE